MTVQWERFDQDGYAFRAVKVWKAGTEPREEATSDGPVMGSTLTIAFDQNF